MCYVKVFLLIVHIIAKKLWERKEKREKKRNVVTSDRTLFCRLQKKEDKEEGEEESSKCDQLIGKCFVCATTVPIVLY